MTEDLTTFMLTSITGIAKEKRKSGTDSETITERTKCLLNTTGIEPLCGELSEILSRSFVINFDLANQASDCFLESEVISAIQQNRDLIISAIMKRTSHVLAMMRDGMRRHAMKLLHEALGNHDKRRCNEYLSLMYLMMLAGSSRQEMEQGLGELAPAFARQIESLNRTSRDTARDSNHTATALATLFNAWRTATETNARDVYGDRRTDPVQEFVQRYQIRFEDDGSLREALSRDLFVALKRVARDFGLRFEMDSSRQFAQRLVNDLETIRGAGFEIEIGQNHRGTKLYTIQSAK
jgi:hypothetical protein